MGRYEVSCGGGCVPRSVEKERRPPLRHQSIISGGNLRVFENLAQTLVVLCQNSAVIRKKEDRPEVAERSRACAFYLFIRQRMGRKSALRREIPWILRGFQGRLSC